MIDTLDTIMSEYYQNMEIYKKLKYDVGEIITTLIDINHIKISNMTLRIKSEEALKKLEDNGNTLEIPGELINVDGINSDLEANVKLSALLTEEEELKIPEEVGQSVVVKVSILPYGSREYDLKADAIQVQGLSSDLRVSYNKEKISIRVKGTEANLNALKVEDIKAVIDLTGKTAGEYTLPVTITLPEGYEQVEEVQATVQLNQAEKTSE